MQLNTYIPNRFEFVIASGSTLENAFMQPVCCACVCVWIELAVGYLQKYLL